MEPSASRSVFASIRIEPLRARSLDWNSRGDHRAPPGRQDRVPDGGSVLLERKSGRIAFRCGLPCFSGRCSWQCPKCHSAMRLQRQGDDQAALEELKQLLEAEESI